MESCIICEKQLEDGIGRYHYPDGDYCHTCGEKSKWYEKFSKMGAVEVIEYMGLQEQYGVGNV